MQIKAKELVLGNNVYTDNDSPLPTAYGKVEQLAEASHGKTGKPRILVRLDGEWSVHKPDDTVNIEPY